MGAVHGKQDYRYPAFQYDGRVGRGLLEIEFHVFRDVAPPQDLLRPDSPKRRETFALGDVNTSLIKTANGRTIEAIRLRHLTASTPCEPTR